MSANAIVKKSALWNPWHGCHKLSEGCMHCYVYRGDARREVDSSVVTQTKSFDVPIRRKRNGEYKIPSGTLVYTCFTSDFFVGDADGWRSDAWDMIRQRSDLHFMMITKRIDLSPFHMVNGWNRLLLGVAMMSVPATSTGLWSSTTFAKRTASRSGLSRPGQSLSKMENFIMSNANSSTHRHGRRGLIPYNPFTARYIRDNLGRYETANESTYSNAWYGGNGRQSHRMLEHGYP